VGPGQRAAGARGRRGRPVPPAGRAAPAASAAHNQDHGRVHGREAARHDPRRQGGGRALAAAGHLAARPLAAGP
ncbi:unnamed protein product, partial [Prorocentrum cordatum]